MEKESLALATSLSEIETGASKDEPAVFTAVENTNDDTKDDDDFEPITLPESTHTLLFTEPIHSRTFLFNSYSCTFYLVLTFIAIEQGRHN